MKTMQRFLFRAWRPALLLISLGLLAYLLYFHHLGSLLPGYANEERTTYAATRSWSDVAENPINAPYKILLLVLATVSHQGILLTRVSAALFGVAAVVIFYFITRAWYGFRLAFFSTILFATSGGFLHFARLGTPDILQMGVLALIGLIVWHRRAPRLHPYLTYAFVVTLGLLLYVPGMIWFEILTLALIHKRIIRHWNRSAVSSRIIWPFLTVVSALPLVFSILKHHTFLMSILGLTGSLHHISSLGGNLWHSILSIGMRSNGSPLLWIGHSPLLNVAEVILGAIGVYYYAFQQRSVRGLLLGGITIMGIILISLGGGVAIVCIIPTLYLLIASGLNHLLEQWLAVFPRNPIARGAGALLISIMVAFSMFYHVRAYFVAWPHNPATRQTFRLPRS
jgi:hypothetical protein